ncbi:MAG: hypothetical protein LUC85_05415 [Bacteroidales bacterium]|nr:hypothetical protein [Bacteroidales bacterium]
MCYSGMDSKRDDISLRYLVPVSDHCKMSMWEVIRYEGGPIGINLYSRFLGASGDGAMRWRLGVVYSTVRGQIERHLLCHEIELGLEGDFPIVDDGLELPVEVATSILSVGIGALRGMIVDRTARTFLARHPLPLFNLTELVDTLIYNRPEHHDEPALVDYVYR